ncbi:MAG: TolC family protein [Candidatus Eisenbacteria bacterium]|uniref:TolC family protein n=1 Tax=Eiseniibacteriota bacterium TaxID=2212470 RepID=A0A538U5H0_UNCEI|nr:MAG: TolC family protein [Candidatus Eisenbacteria bacterium]
MRRALLALALSACASACAVGPDFVRPEREVPPAFAGADSPALGPGDVEAAWWESFGDERLDRLVHEAIAQNYDVRIALANLNEARAARLETKLALLPIVPARAGYQRVRLSEIDAGGASPTFDLFDAGFDATWEVDVWGRIRREVEAANDDIGREEETLRDVVVTVTAEVGRAYVELRGLQEQLLVATRNAENQAATLDLTNALLEEGRGTELDTAQAKAQLERTRAQIPLIESTIRSSIHRLGVLTGRLPTELIPELEVREPIPRCPGEIAIGDPAGLLRRRADVRAAERDVAGATARIGVQVADLFPRVLFVGSVGVAADSFSGLSSGGAGNYAFGPRLQWAAFDLGRVYARIGQADARTDAALARYEKTVLLALEDAENALVDYGKSLERERSLAESERASREAAELARLRYEDGASNFLQVLDAERRLLEAQELLAQSQTDVSVSLIAVYKALGGSWQVLTAPGEPPAPAPVTAP